MCQQCTWDSVPVQRVAAGFKKAGLYANALETNPSGSKLCDDELEDEGMRAPVSPEVSQL